MPALLWFKITLVLWVRHVGQVSLPVKWQLFLWLSTCVLGKDASRLHKWATNVFVLFYIPAVAPALNNYSSGSACWCLSCWLSFLCIPQPGVRSLSCVSLPSCAPARMHWLLVYSFGQDASRPVYLKLSNFFLNHQLIFQFTPCPFVTSYTEQLLIWGEF